VLFRSNPHDANTLSNLGSLLAGRGRIDEALAHYRKALEIEPDHLAANINLANALVGRKQFEEAIVLYRKVLAIQPDLLEGHVNLANALAESGEADEALEHYQKGLSLAAARKDKALMDAIRSEISKLRPTKKDQPK
jgi:tetratricopeptide (TPR) repeat protein